MTDLNTRDDRKDVEVFENTPEPASKMAGSCRENTLFIICTVLAAVAGIHHIKKNVDTHPPTTEEIRGRADNCITTVLPNGWCETPEAIRKWMYDRCNIPQPNRILRNEDTGKMDQLPTTTAQIVDKVIRLRCLDD